MAHVIANWVSSDSLVYAYAGFQPPTPNDGVLGSYGLGALLTR